VAATATVTLHAGDGTVLGTTSRGVGPHEPVQINDIFSAVGAPHTKNLAGWAEIVSDRPIYSYATVIDNQSADSIFIPGLP